MADGAPTVDVLAGRLAKDILSKGNSVPLDAELIEKLAGIIAKFEEKNL